MDELEITDVLELADLQRRGSRGLVCEPAVGEDFWMTSGWDDFLTLLANNKRDASE